MQLYTTKRAKEMMNDNDNYHAPFPRRFRLLFDETRASQATVAEYIGVSRQAVSQWANGNTTPDCYNFKKLADYFNVPLEYLYGDTGSRAQENIRLVNELGLPDEAIDAILAMKSTPYIHPNDSDCPTKSEIFSNIISNVRFWETVEYIQLAIIEYRNHELALDREVGTTPDVLGVGEEDAKTYLSVERSSWMQIKWHYLAYIRRWMRLRKLLRICRRVTGAKPLGFNRNE